MRKSSLVGLVSRLFPTMSPVVRGVHPHEAATTTSTTSSTAAHHHHRMIRFASSSEDASSTSSSSYHQHQESNSYEQVDPPVLLLEGDNFEVSHNGIARTFYHLIGDHLRPSLTDSNSNNKKRHSTPLGIEEYYNLKEAYKTFVIREEGCGDEEQSSEESGDDVKAMVLGKHAQGLAPMGRALGKVDIKEIDEGVFGAAGTGATTWESSLVMGLFFAERSDLLRGSLLEIGSGVGVGAILSHLGPLACHHDLRHVQSVTLTDGNDRCLEQCRKNIRDAWENLSALSAESMESTPEVHVRKLNWNDDVEESMVKKYDTIIACDVCYLYPDIEPLVNTIQALLKKDGCLHLFGPYNRGAFQHLCRRLAMDMHVDIESLQLERYRLRPADNPSNSLQDIVLPSERLYASKSQATILHVTVRHKSDKDFEEESRSVDMEELD